MSAKLQFLSRATSRARTRCEQAMKKNSSKTKRAEAAQWKLYSKSWLSTWNCCKKNNLLFILNWTPTSCSSSGLQFLFCIAVISQSLCIFPCGTYGFVDSCHIVPVCIIGECIYEMKQLVFFLKMHVNNAFWTEYWIIVFMHISHNISRP